MIDRGQLTEILKDLESDRIERKISVNDTDKFGKAVCAFANDIAAH